MYVSHQPSITDAFNETKDKVKYLESLRKYFDQLNVGSSLVNICSNTLPGLMASVRQMDSISRYYARNGYLGLLFSKVITRIMKLGFLIWQQYFIISLSVCSVHGTGHFRVTLWLSNKSLCKTFLTKMSLNENEPVGRTHFHMNGFI